MTIFISGKLYFSIHFSFTTHPPKPSPEKIYAPPCSLQHYLQCLRYGSNLSPYFIFMFLSKLNIGRNMNVKRCASKQALWGHEDPEVCAQMKQVILLVFQQNMLQWHYFCFCDSLNASKRH